MRRVVKEFRGVNNQVCHVLLDNGEVLDADYCIVGAGIIPATKYLKGVTIERDQSVVCDQTLKAADGLYAGGDICRYTWHYTGESVRVEHWGMAQYHGKIAAMNMAGKKTQVHNIPFFWTQMYGKSVRYCGHALSFDEMHFEGNLEELKFIAYYIRQDKVVATVAMGMDPVVSAAAELMMVNKMPSGKEVKQGVDLIKLAASAHA